MERLNRGSCGVFVMLVLAFIILLSFGSFARRGGSEGIRMVFSHLAGTVLAEQSLPEGPPRSCAIHP